MKTHLQVLIALAGALLVVSPASAEKSTPTQDAPDTRDAPGIARYEGSVILLQSRQKFAEFGLQTGGLSSPVSTDSKEVRKVEGGLHRTTYLLPNSGADKRSTLEIARNYEQAFKDAGFEAIWSGGDREIRNGPPRQHYRVPALDHQLLTVGTKERRYFCMGKDGRFAAVFIAARSWEHVMPAKSEGPRGRSHRQRGHL